MNFPETPEGAALFLMTLVLGRRCAEAGKDDMTRFEILALYAHCLRVARGEADMSHDLLH